MKYIELTNSDKRATCDDADFDMLSKYEWFMSVEGFAVTLTRSGIVEMGYMVLNGEPPYEKN